MKTQVVNVTRPPYFAEVYIGRPSKWGNPFKVGEDGTREEVIEKYKQWVQGQPELMASLGELRGKTLGCYCWPHACHGDVLVELVEGADVCHGGTA